VHPATPDPVRRPPRIARLEVLSWLLAGLVLAHAAWHSAFWSDLASAWAARGHYAEARTQAAFRGIPVETLVPRLNAALPADTPVALGEVLERNLFTSQRLIELLYPRRVRASAPHRLEIADAAGFRPERGLELGRTPLGQVFFLSGPATPGPGTPAGEPLGFPPAAFAGSCLAALGLGLAISRLVHAPGTLFLPALILSGALAVAGLATLSTWFQVPVRPIWSNVAGLAACLAVLAPRAVAWARHPSKSPGLMEALRMPENVLFGLALGLLFFIMCNLPIALWDGRSIWLLKAKQLFCNGMMSGADLRDPPLPYQSEYPLLHPAWMAHFSGLVPAYNERLAAAGVPVLLAAVLAMVWQLLRRFTSRGVGAAVALAAFLSVAHLAAGGYADGLLMFLLLIEFLALQHSDSESLGWLAAAAASLTKSEGVIFASLVAGLCVLAVPYLKDRSRARRLAPFLVLVPGFGHILWARIAGLVGAFAGIDWSGVARQAGERLGVIVAVSSAALAAPGYTRSHALVWEGVAGLFVALAIWLGARSPGRSGTLSVLVALACLAFAVTSMLVTPLDLAWHVRTAMDRLLLHPALLALVAPFLLLAEP